MLKLVRALRGCAKRKDVAGAVQLFERHADAGIALPRDAYHTLLSLAVLEDATDVRRQVQWHMRKHDVPVDEVTLTLEVRALVREGDLAAAASGLQTAEVDGIIPKHRTFATLLHALCQERDVETTAAVLAQMQRQGVEMTESDLIQTATLMAATGDETGLETQLHALKELVPRLSKSSIDMLQRALDAATQGHHAVLSTVDSSGRCSCCGARVVALSLSDEQSEQMRRALLGAAAARGGREELIRFGEWVGAREYRYIIDGANVAYRGQNFEGGRFSFTQLELMRRELLNRADGAGPLIILPERYVTADRIPNHVRGGTGTVPVSADEAARVAQWRASGHLWVCPNDSNDDWYWMYAVAVLGANARVLTHDAMRDHVEMARLEDPQSWKFFQRWKERHIVPFQFSFGATPERGEPELVLHPRPSFSREIQWGASGWHFPSDVAGQEDVWLCARRGRQSSTPESSADGRVAP